MHDIRWIRDNAAAFDAALGRRPLSDEDRKRFSSASLLALDDERRKAITAFEQAQAQANSVSKEIGVAMRAKDTARADELKAEANRLKAGLAEFEAAPKKAEDALNDVLAQIPNLPFAAPEVPDGADEHGNVEHHMFGARRNHAFKPKPHFDLGEALGQMDFEAAAKLSGARFVVLKKGLARLERAIGQFMLDVHTGEHGYTEVNPPLLVKDAAMFGTAQLPKFRDDQFSTAPPVNKAEVYEQIRAQAVEMAVKELGKPAAELQLDELFVFEMRVIDDLPQDVSFWLIPTAEVSLTNMVRESIVAEAELPMRLTALTPCFRAEAGAAGRDTRGMIRQHQFTKVELVSITTPEQSRDEHERMLSCAEEILRRLGLHYRVVTLCAGDMGFASQKTYDIEVWMPGQGDSGLFREISSCSVCGDFQARRMDARSRGPDGKPRFVHTLNGSGTAVGRALIAVMETYQQEDGSIAVPDVLQPYMGGVKAIGKA